MALEVGYGQHNYMGEYANDAACLTFIRAQKWDTNGNGTGNPKSGMWYYNTTDYLIHEYRNGSWLTEFSTNGASLYLSAAERIYASSNYIYHTTTNGTSFRCLTEKPLGTLSYGVIGINAWSSGVYDVYGRLTGGCRGTSPYYGVVQVDDYLKCANGVSINEFSSDTTLAGNSDDAVPTEKAVKTYIDTWQPKNAIYQMSSPGGSWTVGSGDSSAGLSLIIGTISTGGINNFLLACWHVPTNAPSDKTWNIKISYKNYQAEYTTSTLYYHLSVYKSGDTYAGWNKVSDASFGSATSSVQNRTEQLIKTLTGIAIEPGDIVTLRLYRSNSPANSLGFTGLELYW